MGEGDGRDRRAGVVQPPDAARGVPIEEALADDQSDNPNWLAMVNVETVHTRWVKDINTFLQAADTQVQEKFDLTIAEWMKDSEREKDESKTPPRYKPKGPAEGGWVVEIRGYTDHEKGRTFIYQALLRNLQRIDTFAKDPGKVGRYIVGVKDPVGKDENDKPRISHAFVYNVFAPNLDPQPNVFFNINRGSYLDAVISPAAQAGGLQQGSSIGGPPGGMPLSNTTSGAPGTPPMPGNTTPGVPGSSGTATGETAPALAPPWSGLSKWASAVRHHSWKIDRPRRKTAPAGAMSLSSCSSGANGYRPATRHRPQPQPRRPNQ